MTDALEIVSRYLEALGDRDPERASQFLSDDVEAVDVPLGLTLRGRPGVVEALAERLRAFPDTSLTVQRIVADADWVATEHVSRGTHRGPLATPAGELPATGRVLETEMAEWFCVQDGLITVSRAYWDVAARFANLVSESDSPHARRVVTGASLTSWLTWPTQSTDSATVR